MKWFSSYPSVPVIRTLYFRSSACTDILISAVYVLILTSWLNLNFFPLPEEQCVLILPRLKRQRNFPLTCSSAKYPGWIDINLEFSWCLYICLPKNLVSPFWNQETRKPHREVCCMLDHKSRLWFKVFFRVGFFNTLLYSGKTSPLPITLSSVVCHHSFEMSVSLSDRDFQSDSHNGIVGCMAPLMASQITITVLWWTDAQVPAKGPISNQQIQGRYQKISK